MRLLIIKFTKQYMFVMSKPEDLETRELILRNIIKMMKPGTMRKIS